MDIQKYTGLDEHELQHKAATHTRHIRLATLKAEAALGRYFLKQLNEGKHCTDEELLNNLRATAGHLDKALTMLRHALPDKEL